MAVGFAFDAVTAEFQHELILEALQDEGAEDLAAPTVLSQGVVGGLAVLLGLMGLALLAQRPGEGRVPGWRLGDRVEAEARPTRCYRCRARMSSDAAICTKCGAERLS